MGLSRAPEMVGREALWRVVRETIERSEINPTPSVFESEIWTGGRAA